MGHPTPSSDSVKTVRDGQPTPFARLKIAAPIVLCGYAALVAVLVGIGALIVHVVAHSAVGHFDMSLPVRLAHRRTPLLNSITQVLSRSADTLGAIGIAVLVSIVLAFRRLWRYIAVLVAGLTLELLTFLAVNFVVDRPRPHVSRLGSLPSTSSFPSGHTAATLVIYLCVAMFVSETVRSRPVRVLAWVAAVVMPLAVAFARVYRGMHNPTDTLGGLLMGIAVVSIVFAALRAGDRVASNGSRAARNPNNTNLKAVA